jgi:hypothetical protein
MRRPVVAIILSLVLLVMAPAAVLAADYPPKASRSAVSHRAAVPAPDGASLPVEGSLAGTGADVLQELGGGAALIMLGGAILLRSRRCRGAVGG